MYLVSYAEAAHVGVGGDGVTHDEGEAVRDGRVGAQGRVSKHVLGCVLRVVRLKQQQVVTSGRGRFSYYLFIYLLVSILLLSFLFIYYRYY